MKKKIICVGIVIVVLIMACLIFALISRPEYDQGLAPAKPVIYLYPEENTDISVNIEFDGTFTCAYPEYGNGWNVTAYPDGKIVNKADGLEYSYLFWEGISNADYHIDTGFVISGNETENFLKEKLSYMGLTPKEYNEFIVYWLPQMIDNPYNLISFMGEDYTKTAKLKIEPKPDSCLRVFMVYKPLETPIEIEEQQLSSFKREGFSVIEWGGSKID